MLNFSRLSADESATLAVQRVWQLVERLFPVCRSITGAGLRTTLDQIGELIPLERTEVATGTSIYDWEIPKEWNIRDACVLDSNGRRVIDFRSNNLHVLNYSTPVDRFVSRQELEEHLYSLPDHPDWIPYRTTYYGEQWGFCLSHRDRLALAEETYRVVIDTELTNGSLSYAECRIPGQSAGEAILFTHVCHPSLANDNLSGIAAAVALAQSMLDARPRLTWRFIFAPGTIGSLTWLSRNESSLDRIEGGLVIGLLGDKGPLTYKRSRRGSSATDRAAEYVLKKEAVPYRCVDFEPYGYDERQFCSPGFDLPIGRLTRSPNGTYPEYHTSADDLSFIDPASIATALPILSRLISVIDENRTMINLKPKGEPRLGKRGLYGSIGGTTPSGLENALLWVLNLADGETDLLAMATRSKVPFDLLASAAASLEAAGLLAPASERGGIRGGGKL